MTDHLDSSGVRVLCVGDVMLDRFVHGGVQRISPEGPVPVMRCERTSVVAGGAANVAANVASLGGNCTLIGVVGRDEAGESLAASLSELPRIVSHLLIDDHRPTTLKTRFIAQGQQLLRVDTEQAEPLSPRTGRELIATLESQMAGHQVLVLSDYAKGVLTPEIIGMAIGLARRHHVPVVVDPKTADVARYAGATVMTPNAKEAEMAVGEDPTDDDAIAISVGRRLLDLAGLESVLITRAHRGMTLVSRLSEPVHLRAAAREVFDVVGAGDTVVATLALSVGAGDPLETAAHRANVAAGIVVGKRGTACVTPEELQRELIRLAARPVSRATPVDPSNLQDTIRAWRSAHEVVTVAIGAFEKIDAADYRRLQQQGGAGRRVLAVVESRHDASDRLDLLSGLDAIDVALAVKPDELELLLRNLDADGCLELEREPGTAPLQAALRLAGIADMAAGQPAPRSSPALPT